MILSGITKMLGALYRWAAVIFAYRLGIRRERQKNAENANEVKDKQLEDAARPSRHRDELITRMRDGKL